MTQYKILDSYGLSELYKDFYSLYFKTLESKYVIISIFKSVIYIISMSFCKKLVH